RASSLFPYTTLFRSRRPDRERLGKPSLRHLLLSVCDRRRHHAARRADAGPDLRTHDRRLRRGFWHSTGIRDDVPEPADLYLLPLPRQGEVARDRVRSVDAICRGDRYAGGRGPFRSSRGDDLRILADPVLARKATDSAAEEDVLVEDGGAGLEVRGRRSEVGGQRSEVRGRRADVRGRRADVGGRI